MSEENNKSQNEKQPRRFSQQQYDMLKRCSDKKDMTEWNEWRVQHPREDIRLAIANLENVYLDDAHLENAYFGGANLKGADFFFAHLEGAQFWFAHLEKANLLFAHLQGAEFIEAYLEGACFEDAIVDGSTLFDHCKVNRYGENDRYTDLSSVGLESSRIDSGTKQLLEYNIRRKKWEEWYKEHKILKWPVWLFWLMSDYGLSTGRIITTFFVLAIVFAGIYYVWGMTAPPGIVDYLFVDGNGVEVARWLVPIRALHFSVVVMTVGFTNMHANAHSFWSHILIGLQMILGFVLLGALVTRFAVLFTAGGPAGKFADENKKDTDDKVS